MANLTAPIDLPVELADFCIDSMAPHTPGCKFGMARYQLAVFLAAHVNPMSPDVTIELDDGPVLNVNAQGLVGTDWTTARAFFSDGQVTTKSPRFVWSTDRDKLDDMHKMKRPYAGRREARDAGFSEAKKKTREIWTLRLDDSDGAVDPVQHQRRSGYAHEVLAQLAGHDVTVIGDCPGPLTPPPAGRKVRVVGSFFANQGRSPEQVIAWAKPASIWLLFGQLGQGVRDRVYSIEHRQPLVDMSGDWAQFVTSGGMA